LSLSIIGAYYSFDSMAVLCFSLSYCVVLNYT